MKSREEIEKKLIELCEKDFDKEYTFKVAKFCLNTLAWVLED